MELRKSHWVSDGDRVSLAVPIAKIDKENRLVSGFATLDNIDTSDDVVTSEASAAAFEAWRGNVREMHQPIAAGRVVDFKEDEFFYDGEFYRGIYVTTYVSKGAPDTWEKVLDGTLSGFSIGGNITQQETKFVKDAGPNGKNIRFINGYDLIELSLVDNPANQLANVFSVVKSAEGSFIKGMITETKIVNVFWCGTDEVAKNSTEESETCLSCGSTMEQIGWFETGENNAVKTAAAVADFLRLKEALTEKHTDGGKGGGETMTEEVKKSDVVTSDDVSGEEKPEEVVEEVETEGAENEAEEVVEEAPVEADVEKMIGDLKGYIMDSIDKVEKFDERVEALTKKYDEKSAELEKSLGELSAELKTISENREGVEKRLDALEKSTAIKKSGDVETEPVTKAKNGSFWGSTFFEEK